MGTWAAGMILLAWAYLNAIWFCQVIILAVKARMVAAMMKKKVWKFVPRPAQTRTINASSGLIQKSDRHARKPFPRTISNPLRFWLRKARLRLSKQPENRLKVKMITLICAEWSASIVLTCAALILNSLKPRQRMPMTIRIIPVTSDLFNSS